MRVSDKMNFQQVTNSLNKTREKMAIKQEQATTMKRINKPSDDPVAATRVLEARTNIQSAEQYIRNANQAKNFLDYSERTLEELSNVLIRLKEVALGQSNSGTSNPVARRAIAMEVEQIYDQMNAIGNRKIGDRYIFGGYVTQRSPFEQGQYTGDSGEMEIEINRGVKLAMNVPGDIVFMGRSIEAEKAAQEDQDYQLNQALRGPASINQNTRPLDEPGAFGQGVDVFQAVKRLEIALRADDTRGVQNSLDKLDTAINQVVMSRADVGSRLNALENNIESLQKGLIDNKILASKFEDADAFEVYSELQAAEGNLKASLSTSGRLIQPSLLDFLR
ncbi:MAG: flagellar hook-associated protein FlgL [Bdellovibrionales bacterium]